MKRFRKIVVGVDLKLDGKGLTPGTWLAVNQARWLAERVESHVTLVHSRASDECWDAEEKGYVVRPTVTPAVDQQTLEQLAAGFQERNIRTALVSVTEAAWLAITRQVLHEEADLVIVGKRTRADDDLRKIGSVTNKLLRKCPCAVWAVNPGSDPNPKTVLAATDLSPVGRRVVEVAASLVAEYRSQLHVVHAYQLPLDVQMEGTRAREEFDNQMRSKATEEIEGQLRGAALERAASLHIGLTSPTRAILECVDRLAPDLIVMGTISRGGIPGVLVGNTAERLLHRLDCSLLTVKPDDFVCPVEPKGLATPVAE
ncbi:MAG: universal stress protein [Deltaproteobacteria bacterium]|nr:universal stress protein [Deltaproteobacteria bacterium]MBW2421067.1 universal stress protein [Deltaproteobacteria bacterium]